MTRPSRTTIDPYGAQLHYARSPEQWAVLARRFEFDPEIDSQGETRLVVDTQTWQPHLCVHVETSDPGQTNRLVIHEATHAAAMLLDHIEQPYNGTSEALAYLVAWVADWLLSKTEATA